MLTTYTISADSMVKRRQIACPRAHADRFRNAQVYALRTSGARIYEVDVLVTR
jgi:hypothetical protein